MFLEFDPTLFPVAFPSIFTFWLKYLQHLLFQERGWCEIDSDSKNYGMDKLDRSSIRERLSPFIIREKKVKHFLLHFFALRSQSYKRNLVFKKPKLVSKFMKELQFRSRINIQSNSVITNSTGPANFVRYNWVDLCSKMTMWDWKIRSL